MASKARKIDAIRNDRTGEIEPAHLLGTTKSGKPLYKFYEGWTPVAQMQDGTYRDSTGLRCDRDGNYTVSGPPPPASREAGMTPVIRTTKGRDNE